MPYAVNLADLTAHAQNPTDAIPMMLLTQHIDRDPDHAIECDVPIEGFNDRIVLLVDDVLNSGRTLIHGVQFLLQGRPREVHTAVLVDRKHRSFPIRADYCGLTLSTHLNEHIAVDLSDTENATVHLERPAVAE